MLFFVSPQYCCFRSSEFQHCSLPRWGRKHSPKKINIPVFQICCRNNKTLLLYACEVIYLINKGVILPYVQEQCEILLKFILRLYYVTHYWAWMAVFLKQPWSNTRSTLCSMWENNLETFEKLFSMIQSGCSIYSHFLKPLYWNIHELKHQALIVMKISVQSIRASKIGP